MKIKVLESFSEKLNSQLAFIAEDKPAAARQFKKDVISLINVLDKMSYQNRKSIYFEDSNIRELIFKGYKIVYRIKPDQSIIEVFGFIKQEKNI